jgi:hypothetical protein
MDCHSSIDGDSSTASPRDTSDSRSERALSPQDFPFDEQPERPLPPVKKRHRHAYFQTAESMRVLSQMEYAPWPMTTTIPVIAAAETTTSTNVSTVAPPAVSAPSSRRQVTENSEPVMPARTIAPQQPHPWTWDTSTYTSFPPPSRQSSPSHHLTAPPSEPLFPVWMPHLSTLPPPPPHQTTPALAHHRHHTVDYSNTLPDTSTTSPRDSDPRTERALSPQDFPFDEQPERSLPPVKKRHRRAYFQTAESMRVLSQMEYASWPTTTTLATETTTTTNVSTVTPPAVSAPSSRRQVTENSESVMPARAIAPQQPHPWTWDTSTYTSFPPPSRQSSPSHHLTAPPPEPLFPVWMPHLSALPPPPPPHQTAPALAHHRTHMVDYSNTLPPLPPPPPPPVTYARGPPQSPTPTRMSMSLYPSQSVLARGSMNHDNNSHKKDPHDETARSMVRVGHECLGIFRGRLPEYLRASLNDLIDLAEQRAACLPDKWKSDLYSLTKQDLPVSDIPGSLKVVEPISQIICEQIRRLYGRSVRMHNDQPHVLKYSCADQHTGVQLHHDRCDVTANLTLSRDGDYQGGGTYYTATGSTLRCAQGEFVLHLGSLIHAGTDITAGTRHLLVFFCHFE